MDHLKHDTRLQRVNTKILFLTSFLVYFSLQVLPMTWRHIWTVQGCIRYDHFTGREAIHQIWQVLPISTSYSIHMIVYNEETKRIWVETQAKTKRNVYIINPSCLTISSIIVHSWAGYLNNTVSGGITSGLTIWELLVKESWEEAGLDPSIVKKYAISVGAISFFALWVTSTLKLNKWVLGRHESGWTQPNIAWVV